MRVLVPLALAALLAGCSPPSNSPPVATSAPIVDVPTQNGIASLPPEEIVTRAQAALGKVGSYRMKGEITLNGQVTKIDLQNGGENVKGTIEVDGQGMEILRIGKDLYLKASERFWKTFTPESVHNMVPLLADKYVKVDATNESFSALTETFDVSEIVKVGGKVTAATPTIVNGTPAIGLVSEDERSTLYIATVGEPTPLRIEGTPGQGGLNFSDYGKPIEFATPASSEVFDLKSLTGG
jgi:hypothetical protein